MVMCKSHILHIVVIWLFPVLRLLAALSTLSMYGITSNKVCRIINWSYSINVNEHTTCNPKLLPIIDCCLSVLTTTCTDMK